MRIRSSKLYKDATIMKIVPKATLYKFLSTVKNMANGNRTLSREEHVSQAESIKGIQFFDQEGSEAIIGEIIQDTESIL